MRGAVFAGILLAGLSVPALAQSTPPQSGAAALPALTEADLRELVEAAKATAKAAREGVDYARVTPDILTQILAKLDKIENKLDKIENAVKAGAPRRSGR
jgi:hypothetical protein